MTEKNLYNNFKENPLGIIGKTKHRCFAKPNECPLQCPTSYETCPNYYAKLNAFGEINEKLSESKKWENLLE